jgi:hypothetical protein
MIYQKPHLRTDIDAVSFIHICNITQMIERPLHREIKSSGLVAPIETLVR